VSVLAAGPLIAPSTMAYGPVLLLLGLRPMLAVMPLHAYALALSGSIMVIVFSANRTGLFGGMAKGRSCSYSRIAGWGRSSSALVSDRLADRLDDPAPCDQRADLRGWFGP
jgi:hypothetical protein